MSNFDLFENRLRITGIMELETALRVGSGLTDELSKADISVVKDSQRRPYIPGSSFKGALRAHIERIIRLVEPEVGSGVGACNPLSDKESCIDIEKMKELKDEFGDDLAGLDAEVYDQSCRICRIFGSPWLASRVLIKDLLLVEPNLWLERRFQVRHGVGIDRDSETASQGLLYDYETVPSGTRFKWEILIENADRTRADDGLVIWGLNEFANSRVQIGGSRSRGLGWIKLLFDDQAEFIDASNRETFVKYLTSGKGDSLSRDEVLERAIEFARVLANQEI